MPDVYKDYKKEMNFILESFSEKDEHQTEESIRESVTKIKSDMFKYLSQEIVDQICRVIESKYVVTQSSGFSLKKSSCPDSLTPTTYYLIPITCYLPPTNYYYPVSCRGRTLTATVAPCRYLYIVSPWAPAKSMKSVRL